MAVPFSKFWSGNAGQIHTDFVFFFSGLLVFNICYINHSSRKLYIEKQKKIGEECVLKHYGSEGIANAGTISSSIRAKWNQSQIVSHRERGKAEGEALARSEILEILQILIKVHGYMLTLSRKISERGTKKLLQGLAELVVGVLLQDFLRTLLR